MSTYLLAEVIIIIIIVKDLESEEQTISFSKNGQDHGVAFKLSENIQGKPLFPHVFTRNVALLVNFGAEVVITIAWIFSVD